MWGDAPPRQPQPKRWADAAALIAGAVLLVWPALANHYPIVFSDTHAFLVQASEPLMVWDKPWFYGPFLRLLHGNTTLWLPLAGQGLILSHLLWLARAAFARPTAGFHLGLCLFLALGSAAPWFAALLMPDILAPVAVLGLYLVAFPGRLGRAARIWLAALAGFAITTHLSFLPLAAAVILLALLFGGRRLVLAPLAAAIALLVASNAIGHGRIGLSPYGAVFALARLVSDGPAQTVLARDCPQAGWRLCDWIGRFPADSDNFLWDGTGPVWSTPGGPQALAPEAAAIVARTLATEPAAVALAALANAWRQFTLVQLGDALGPDWLEVSITGSLKAYFPPEEMARFRAGRQIDDQLRAIATPLNPPHALLLGIGALVSLAALLRAWRRRDRAAAAFATILLAAVLVNAAASGALSKPNPRYQARIAWLVLLPPLLPWRSQREQERQQQREPQQPDAALRPPSPRR